MKSFSFLSIAYMSRHNGVMLYQAASTAVLASGLHTSTFKSRFWVPYCYVRSRFWAPKTGHWFQPISAQWRPESSWAVDRIGYWNGRNELQQFFELYNSCRWGLDVFLKWHFFTSSQNFLNVYAATEELRKVHKWRFPISSSHPLIHRIILPATELL